MRSKRGSLVADALVCIVITCMMSQLCWLAFRTKAHSQEVLQREFQIQNEQFDYYLQTREKCVITWEEDNEKNDTTDEWIEETDLS